MNIKALITTLVLGSSSMASADSLTFSGSVSVSLGSTRPVPAPIVIRDSRHPVIVHDEDDCDVHTSPLYRPYGYHQVATQPVWHAPVYNPTNTVISSTGSGYTGAIFGARRYLDAGIRASNAWYDLSEATRIDAGRQFFKIGAEKGQFRGIRLEALGNGRSKIDQVTIEFADAQGRAKHQVVKLNSWIGRGNASLAIDLDGNYRQITRIIVYGATERGSAYKLMAL